MELAIEPTLQNLGTQHDHKQFLREHGFERKDGRHHGSGHILGRWGRSQRNCDSSREIAGVGEEIPRQNTVHSDECTVLDTHQGAHIISVSAQAHLPILVQRIIAKGTWRTFN